jgi:YD repeat-containing protein
VTTTYSYDALDRVTSENVPLDLNHAQHTVTASVYDVDGRVTRSVQNCVNGCPVGAASDTSTNVTTTTAYDAAGNATLTTDPVGNQTYTTFDALNRPVDVKRQSGGATPTVVSETQTSYDGAGNVVSTVVDPGDPNGTPPHKNLTTTYTFDADRDIVALVDGSDAARSFEMGC